MRELTPETITDAVLDQMATTPDPRLKTIMASAVKHLHAFAREVNLTPGEWIKGIEFMTLAGKMCSPERQEFILLSDTLGLSALVNGLHDKTAIEEGTHTRLVGAPGYRELVTALYLRDDPHLADDVVFGSSGDLAVDVVPNDPDCPIKDMPSIRFDMRLSRESEADKTSGRVGADPAAIMKQARSNEKATA